MGNHEFCDICGESIYHRQGECDVEVIKKEKGVEAAFKYLKDEVSLIRERCGGSTKEGKNKTTIALVEDVAWRSRTSKYALEIAHNLKKILEER